MSHYVPPTKTILTDWTRTKMTSRVVLSEQQHRIFDFDRVTTMRVYVTAAAKRTAVVKEDDLLTKADIQANPVK
eukprot:2717657-Pyramimonas_sp.AAC.1